MENVMMMNNGFAELSEIEMYDVAGGWSWKKFGIGLLVGAAAALVCTGVGALAGVAISGCITGMILGSYVTTGALLGAGIGAIVGAAAGGVAGGLKD